ncbi:MAG: hypothetical protein HY298_05420 [Verrucomicrobia bacterium]|nr:hypothetical protein [Verrucomicrobiota bacterium]
MKTNANPENLTRRAFLKSAGLTTAFVAIGGSLPVCCQPAAGAQKVKDTYETHAKGIRILPGEWRPHYRWEQIAWISPAWPSQEYLWLDFPEEIFSNQGLLFLSHVNPKFPGVFPDLPAVPWQEISNGLAFERRLPKGVSFGGSVVRKFDTTVGLELHIENGSQEPLTDIKLQTCLYLRTIKEFADFTNENKFVHLPDLGWQSYPKANEAKVEAGRYRLGWRTGRALADWSIMATVSNESKRLVAFTWLKDGFSLVCNPRHPCMHSDPKFPDLVPGAKASIHGEIIFFEGTLDDFSAFLKKSGDPRG